MHVKTNTSHNTTEPFPSLDQPGGVSITTTFEATTHRFKEFSSDPRNLGRWTSVCLNGRQGHTLRLVSVYSPNKTTGETTVYTQQATYLRAHNIDADPVKQLQSDFKHTLNEEIIVYIDANEDIRKGSWATLFSELGMHDIRINKSARLGGNDGTPLSVTLRQNQLPESLSQNWRITTQPGGQALVTSDEPMEIIFPDGPQKQFVL